MALPETITDARVGADHRADHVELHKRFNKVIDVTSAPYNAVGNGTINDTTAVQAAFDAADSTGWPVCFPLGDYLCGTLNYRNQILLGDGVNNSWITGLPSQDVLHGDTTLTGSSRQYGGIHNLTIRVDDSVDAAASFAQRGGVGNACLAYDYPNGAVAAPMRLEHFDMSNVRFWSTDGELGNNSVGLYTQTGGAACSFKHITFQSLKRGWAAHYPTSNLASTELAFDHSSWEDIFFTVCQEAGVFVNLGYCSFTNIVVHANESTGASGIDFVGVTSAVRGSTFLVSLKTLMFENLDTDPLTFSVCNNIMGENISIAGMHPNWTIGCDDSTFDNIRLSNDTNDPPQIVFTGARNTITNIVMGDAEAYGWPLVDDQGLGNSVIVKDYTGASGARNRFPHSLVPDARVRHERDSISLLKGYVDPPFVSGNDLLMSPLAIHPTGMTKVTQWDHIQDTTSDLGVALKLIDGGGFYTDTGYMNGEGANVIGGFLPKARVRVYLKLKATTGGTHEWLLKYGAANTLAGDDTFTLTTSYQVFSFDADLRSATLADKITLQANTIGGGGAAPVYMAWVMFRVFDADVLSSGNISTYGILGVGGLAGAVLVPTVSSGSGTPEGAVTAPIGSTYHRTNGGAGTSFYVKESGTGNTGWVAK